MRNKYVISALALALTVSAGSSFAKSSVIGQQYTGKQEVSYIQGDVVKTAAEKSSTIMLTSGQSAITVAPNSIASVNGVEPLTVSLEKGSVAFEAAAKAPVTLVSPNGTFTVSSSEGASAVAVIENGNFAVISKQGQLLVEDQSTNSVSTLESGKVFVSNEANETEVVNVALGGGAASGKTIAIVAAAIAGVAILAKATEDDDEPAAAAAAPAASPAN